MYGIFDPDEVITIYALKEAVEDGALVEIFKNRWKELSAGKPIVATVGLFENVSVSGLTEIWNEYVLWRTKVMPKLPEEKRLFSTEMNHLTVWVIEDDVAFTLMHPAKALSPQSMAYWTSRRTWRGRPDAPGPGPAGRRSDPKPTPGADARPACLRQRPLPGVAEDY